MDHRVQPEQVGVRQSSSNEEDGANYLRRLRGAGDDASQGAVPTKVAFSPVAETSPTGKERRRCQRYRCSGSAEFRAEGSEVRMWGTLTDISLQGCYVEMTSTFPVDTRVDLTLEAVGIRVLVRASVRVSYPFLGMGMCFTEIEPGQQLQLEQLLSVLAGQGSLPKPNPALTEQAAGDASMEAIVTASDPQAVLNEVHQFFAENRLLSREEFILLAKRATRS